MSLLEHKIWSQWAAAPVPAKKPLPEIQQLALRDLSATGNEASLRRWLVEQGWLTQFQANVLTRGGGAALQLGEFLLLDRSRSSNSLAQYVARHQPSSRDFLLDFFNPQWRAGEANGPADGLTVWSDFRQRVETLAQMEHGHLQPVLGCIELPEYSFVVSELPEGGPLAEKLPRKTRMSWEMAAQFGVQIAAVLGEVHRRGAALGGWSVADVRLVGKQRVVLQTPWVPRSLRAPWTTGTGERVGDFFPNHADWNSRRESGFNEADSRELTLDQAVDWYSLGCFLQRLITGRLVAETEEPEVRQDALSHAPGAANTNQLTKFQPALRNSVDWNKYQVPEAAGQLLEQLASPHAKDWLLAGAQLVEQFAQRLQSKPERIIAPPQVPEVARKLRQRWSNTIPDLSPLAAPLVEQLPEQLRQLEDIPASSLADQSNTAASAGRPRVAARRRGSRRPQWVAWLAASAMLLVSVAIAVPWLQSRPLASGNNQSLSNTATPVANASERGNESAANEPAVELPPPILAQSLVDDDGLLPWESPTLGPKQSFAWLPPAARMLVAVRPRDWLQQPESALVIQALGPGVANWIAEARRLTGMELEDWDKLTIALYSQSGKRYDVCLLVTLVEPITIARWQELTQSERVTAAADPATETTESETAPPISILWRREQWQYLTVPPPGASDRVQQFVLGPPRLIEESRTLGPVESLSGPLAQLADRCDAQRHVSVLFLPPALFNDEGQALMSGTWAPANRWLRDQMDENIRSGLLSLHWQEGCYVELWLEHARDIKPADLVTRLQERLRTIRDQATTQLTSLPAAPYWDRARAQLFGMIGDVWRRLRYGVEQNQVIVNGWLPPMAMHNVLAGAELGMFFAGGGVAQAKPTAQVSTPQTLEELLQLPRNLQVTTNPDLNLLLQSIQTEVREQFPNLPFEFQIQLQGNDLAVEGITQNQRPGDFELRDTKLADILTQIMVRANPDKSATGPDDPKCKLVWIIAADEAGTGKTIKITTRAAAAEKKWELPPQFQQLK